MSGYPYEQFARVNRLGARIQFHTGAVDWGDIARTVLLPGAILALVLGVLSRSWVLVVAIVLALAAMVFWRWRDRNKAAATYERGIAYYDCGHLLLIPWTQIKSVEDRHVTNEDGSTGLSGIDLCTRTGRRVRLSNTLSNFGDLWSSVHAHAPSSALKRQSA